MIDLDRFFQLVSEVCDNLPDELFDDLHYGVHVVEDLKISPHARADDLIIMGEYQASRYGNRIVIYYGSFERMYPFLDEEALKEVIHSVVVHEFRHHMENRAGMHGKDSLEQEDKDQLRMYLRGVK